MIRFALRLRMRTFLFVLHTVMSLAVNAQSNSNFMNLYTLTADTLPPLIHLESQIISYFQQSFSADSIRLINDEKGDWTKYIPSIGFGYTLAVKDGELRSALRPSASISSNVIFQSIKEKRERKRLVESLKITNQITINEQLLKVRNLYRNYEIRIGQLSHYDELLEIERSLFAIAKDEFKEAVMDSKSFLNARKVIAKVEFDYKSKLIEIELLKVEILRESKIL